MGKVTYAEANFELMVTILKMAMSSVALTEVKMVFPAIRL